MVFRCDYTPHLDADGNSILRTDAVASTPKKTPHTTSKPKHDASKDTYDGYLAAFESMIRREESPYAKAVRERAELQARRNRGGKL